MSNSKRPSSSENKERSFLEEWSKQRVTAYLEEYGGERAGVPKGQEIPFPAHKVQAGLALLAYGSPSYGTLAAIARRVRVTGPLLRVWRTEERFLALYRRTVWECADDYVRLLSMSWNDQWIAPYQEFQKYFGVALQEAILRRLCLDVFHMDPEWEHLGLGPRWLSECKLIGVPPKALPPFSKDENVMLNINTLLLLATTFVQRRIQDPVMAQWASSELLDKWSRSRIIGTELRAAVENDKNKEALGLIDLVTVHPLDDVRKLYRLLCPARKMERR